MASMPDPKQPRSEIPDSITDFERSLSEALYANLDEQDEQEEDDTECSPSSDGQ
jgi:hypothetical protein